MGLALSRILIRIRRRGTYALPSSDSSGSSLSSSGSSSMASLPCLNDTTGLITDYSPTPVDLQVPLYMQNIVHPMQKLPQDLILK